MAEKDRQITEREQTRKIFLGGINPGTSEDFLKDFFKKYGEITDCCVIKTSGPEKKSRGFGFVTFTKSSMVDAVMEDRVSSKLIIDGREVEIKRAVSREEAQIPTVKVLQRKVFVGGIQKLTEERIAEYFLQFGKVEETVIPIDKSNNNKKRGFAFVIFSDTSTVKEVVDIQNHTIDGVVVECKKATPQEKDMRSMRNRGMQERMRNEFNDGFSGGPGPGGPGPGFQGGNFGPGGGGGGFNRGWGGGGYGGGFGGGFGGGGGGYGPGGGYGGPGGGFGGQGGGGYGGGGWGRGWGSGWSGWGGSGWGSGSGYGGGSGGWGGGWGGYSSGGGGSGGYGSSSGGGGSGGGGSGGGGGGGSGGSGYEGRGFGSGGYGSGSGQVRSWSSSTSTSLVPGGTGGGKDGGGGGGSDGIGSGGGRSMGGGGGGGGGSGGGGDFGSNYGSQSSNFGPMRQSNGSSGRYMGQSNPYGVPYGSGGGGGSGSGGFNQAGGRRF